MSADLIKAVRGVKTNTNSAGHRHGIKAFLPILLLVLVV